MKINKLIAMAVLLSALLICGLAASVLVSQKPLGAKAAPPAQAGEGANQVGEAGEQAACTPEAGETVTITTAKLYVEYNASDEDLGVHGAFEDDGWSKLCVYDPNGALVMTVGPQGQLNDLTMAGIFFESREPPSAEFSFEELEAKFPEGQYQVHAITFDGKELTGAATFTHNVPAPPAVTFPAIVDEEQAGEVVVPTTGLVIEWQDVTETVAGDPVTISGYEVIITKVEHDDPHGFSRPVFDVHVPPNRNSLNVPVEFLEPGTVYELELLAIEESGNQTITVGFFTTE